jgi:hypothetical protein
MNLTRKAALPSALIAGVLWGASLLVAAGAAAAPARLPGEGATLWQAEQTRTAEARTAIEPRRAVERIAALIRADFYEAARAARIANTLEADAAAGAFDRFTDPRDLSFELTRRLSSEDRHFAVSWAAPDANRQVALPAAPPEASRTNHGFVEARVLAGGVGYLKIDQFAPIDSAASPARRAADAALGFVAATPSLIIDLRDNGGGSPAMVGYLVQQFVAEPARIANRFKSRRGPDRLELSPVPASRPPRVDTPLYILVSGRTGSAAEAFAYTLQAAGRATIVGERTGGAANPGTIHRTDDGFRIFISGGTPVNPITARNWEMVGVQPNVAVPHTEALQTAHLRALEAEGPALPGVAADVLETLRVAGAQQPVPDQLAGRYGDLEIVAEAGAALLRQGRRPERTLVALGGDRFSLAEDPAARLRFERAPQSGAVMALVRELPGGSEVRYHRLPAETAALP